jgi:hypothetical protein
LGGVREHIDALCELERRRSVRRSEMNAKNNHRHAARALFEGNVRKIYTRAFPAEQKYIGQRIAS